MWKLFLFEGEENACFKCYSYKKIIISEKKFSLITFPMITYDLQLEIESKKFQNYGKSDFD